VSLARAYELLGQPRAAIEVLDPLLSGQAAGDARAAHAQALLSEGQPDAALEEVSAAAAADRTSVDAPLLQGQLLAQRRQFPAAEQALLTASQRISRATPLPERAGVLAALTESRLAQGKLAEAEESRAGLAKLFPDAPITLLLGARIKLARGQSQEGIADLQRVVQSVPSFVAARVLLGAAELSRGNLNQAQLQLQQALQQSPDNLDARELLARVRLLLHQPQGGAPRAQPGAHEGGAD